MTARSWTLVVTWNGHFALGQMNLSDMQIMLALVEVNRILDVHDPREGVIQVRALQESPTRH